MQFVTWMVNINGELKFSHYSKGGGDRNGRDHGSDSSDLMCYECGELDHFSCAGCELDLENSAVAATIIVVELIPIIVVIQVSIRITLPL